MLQLKKVTRFFLHHSAFRISAMPEQFNIVRRSHINRGWGDIGYHGFIESDGTIPGGRPLEYQGAHNYGQNSDSLGVCMAGNFDIDLPTDAQIHSLKRILNGYRLKYGDLPLLLHRDTRNTHCPGLKVTVDYLLGKGIKVADQALLRRFEGNYVQRPEHHGEVYKVIDGHLLYLKASPGPLFDDLCRRLQKRKELTGLSEKNWSRIEAALIK